MAGAAMSPPMTARRVGRSWIDGIGWVLPVPEISLWSRAKWATPPLGVKRASDQAK
jgi:hypothetical protein